MIYIVIFLLSSVCLLEAKKNENKKVLKTIYFIMSIMLPVLLAAYRSLDVGIDVKVYIKPYTDLARYSNSFYDYLKYMSSLSVEPGYSFITYIGNKVAGINGVFFLSEILLILPVYIRMLDFEQNEIFSASFIFLCLFYNLSLNISRQSIALGIIFFATRYCKRGSLRYYYILTVFAILFHFSGIIGLFIPFLYILSKGQYSKFKEALLICFLIIFIVFYNQIFTFLINILFTNASKYIKTFTPDSTGYLSVYNVLFNAMAIFFVIFNRYNLKMKGLYHYYLLVSIFSFLLYLLTYYNGNCFRYSLYFILFTPIIVSKVQYRFKQEDRIFINISLCTLYLFYWFIFNIITDAYGTIPYAI